MALALQTGSWLSLLHRIQILYQVGVDEKKTILSPNLFSEVLPYRIKNDTWDLGETKQEIRIDKTQESAERKHTSVLPS